jgi:hypothetical protein
LAVARGSFLVCIPASHTSWVGLPRISSSSLAVSENHMQCF